MPSMPSGGSDPRDRLAHARVLAHIGELFDAELEAAQILESDPENLDALSLFAQLKHMRGQLSQASACWAQIHSRAPDPEMALKHLRAILHLAQDPERGAGEFLALGQFQLVRKPAAHLEIEEAFRLFLSRRPTEAQKACEDLAARYRGRDRQLYKLAVLASAWIAEWSGDREVAAARLERLGSERGFETDSDRVMALARFYERSGSRDKLESAVHIYHFLERRFDKITILSQLADLYRRLGQDGLAEEYETRYLEAFRRRNHRPTLAEAAEVAAQSYLPLERLCAATWLPSSSAHALGPRASAVAAALRGDRSAAKEGFVEGGEILDEKYLADLSALEGERDEAVELYLSALRSDPTVLRVLGVLLDRYADTPAVERFFADPELLRGAHETLRAALTLMPLRPSLWRQLARLLELHPEGRNEAASCRERAAILEQAERERRNPIGRALTAGVYHFVGGAKGLIHEVWVGREPARPGLGGRLPSDSILGNLTAEMKSAVQNTFLSAREYAWAKFPHLCVDILDYDYTYKLTKEDEPSYGLSASLPSALAFLSVFLQWPIPQDVAAPAWWWPTPTTCSPSGPWATRSSRSRRRTAGGCAPSCSPWRTAPRCRPTRASRRPSRRRSSATPPTWTRP